MKTGMDSPVPSLSVAMDRHRAAATLAPQRRFATPLALLAMLLLAALNVQAQNVQDGYTPLADEVVSAVATQTDGKALIGGGFTQVNGQPCAYICRLSADGSVDSTFTNSAADADVNAVAVQADGKILVGGDFGMIAGQVRSGVARLNADGSLDASFVDANVSGDPYRAVWALAVQADGKVLVGGYFDSVGGQARRSIARLNADGSLDASFADPDLGGDGAIYTVAQQADGKLLIGGEFTSAGGQARHNFARLNTDGALDTSFADPNIDAGVAALVLRPDGKIVIAGYFGNVASQPRGRLARLNADGTLDTTFGDLQISKTVFSLAWQADGKLLLAGGFDTVGSQPYDGVARLNINGSVDASFTTGSVNGGIRAVAVQADGKVLLGGYLVTSDNDDQTNLARLNVDGALDSGMGNVAADHPVQTAALQPDGRVVIAGAFDAIGGQARSSVARFNPDGRIDVSFVNSQASGYIAALLVQADGKVLVGGDSDHIGGLARTYLARLKPDGSVDASFTSALNPVADGGVTLMAQQLDGKIVIAGAFEANGVQRLARLNADGSLDGGFVNASVNERIAGLALQTDGKIVISGNFTTAGGQPRNRLARLNTDGSLDTTFVNPSADFSPTVAMVTLQPDGKFLLNGDFISFNGQARNGLVRLNADGSLDSGFANPASPGPVRSVMFELDGKIVIAAAGSGGDQVSRLNANGTLDTSFVSFSVSGGTGSIYTLAQQIDGKLLLGGSFDAVAGQARGSLARVSLPVAAQQSLDVNGGTVIWRRSGVGPELRSAPILSYSSDGSTFTALGPMTRVAGGWQRSNVPASIDSFYYLRVEGRVGNSQLGGSGDGLIQSVREVFGTGDFIFADGFE